MQQGWKGFYLGGNYVSGTSLSLCCSSFTAAYMNQINSRVILHNTCQACSQGHCLAFSCMHIIDGRTTEASLLQNAAMLTLSQDLAIKTSADLQRQVSLVNLNALDHLLRFGSRYRILPGLCDSVNAHTSHFLNTGVAAGVACLLLFDNQPHASSSLLETFNALSSHWSFVVHRCGLGQVCGVWVLHGKGSCTVPRG